jgi:hypothetical protein
MFNKTLNRPRNFGDIGSGKILAKYPEIAWAFSAI